MNLLARLMSHGFAIALVLLLAVGFIYRGELFPEWELPEFLAFDSAKDTVGDRRAGKIEPLPVQIDRPGPGQQTGGRAISEIKVDSASTSAVSGTMPPVEKVVEAATMVAKDKSAKANATAESVAPADVVAESAGSLPAAADATAESAPEDSDESAVDVPVVDAAAEPVPAVANASSEPAVAGADESAADGGAGMSTAERAAAVVPPAGKDLLAEDASTAMETDQAPVQNTARASAGQAAISTSPADAAEALAQSSEPGHADRAAKSGLDTSLDTTGAMDSATAIPAVGMSPEPVRGGGVKSSQPAPAPATFEVTSPDEPAGEIDMPAKTVSAPTASAMDAGMPAETGADIALVAPETGVSGSAMTPEAVTAGDDDADPAYTLLPAELGPGPQDSAPVVATVDSTLSSYQLLALAREAYWMREYQVAEDYYRQMILSDPDNPDGYGELANMYFSQGDWEAAASAYYEAGSRLVEAGLLARARGMVDVIRGLSGPQADALEHEIESAQAESQ